MGHRWDCPTRWEAERQGERAFERGYGSNPYRETWGETHCCEAERSWEDGRRAAELRDEERRSEERAAHRRREAREMEEAYYRQLDEEQMQRAYEQEANDYYRAEEEAYYAGLWREQFIDLPTWADDGGPQPELS
jgi:hypothetical protein